MFSLWRRSRPWCAPVLPVLASLYFISLLRTPGTWLFTNGDPDFSYWFNGLRLTDGAGPFHVDHPGTLLQLFAGVLWRARYLVLGAESGPVSDFLAHSVSYQASYISFSIASFLVAQWYSGFRVLRDGHPVFLAWGLQLVPFLVLDSFTYLFHLAPESWIVVLCLFLFPLLARLSLSL